MQPAALCSLRDALVVGPHLRGLKSTASCGPMHLILKTDGRTKCKTHPQNNSKQKQIPPRRNPTPRRRWPPDRCAGGRCPILLASPPFPALLPLALAAPGRSDPSTAPGSRSATCPRPGSTPTSTSCAPRSTGTTRGSPSNGGQYPSVLTSSHPLRLVPCCATIHMRCESEPLPRFVLWVLYAYCSNTEIKGQVSANLARRELGQAVRLPD
jgi:hypothetical protein